MKWRVRRGWNITRRPPAGWDINMDPYGPGSGPIPNLAYFRRNGNGYQAIHGGDKTPYAIVANSGYDRFEVHHGDTHAPDPVTSERAEANAATRQPFGQDIWIAYGQRLNRTAPTLDNNGPGQGWVVIGQLWATPDPSDISRSPVLAIVILHNELVISTRHDWNATTTTAPPSVNRFVDPNPVFGSWVQWVIRVRPEKTQNGSLAVWRDGVQIIDAPSIPIGYNDTLGHRWQYGVYRYTDSSQATFIADYANVEVGLTSLQSRVTSPLPITS